MNILDLKQLRLILLLMIPALWFKVGCAQEPVKITADELQSHITYLASGELKGRKPGTPGGKKAAEYVRDQFDQYGLVLPANNGFQSFKVVTGVTAGEGNNFRFNDFNGELKKDFIPLSFSDNDTLTAGVVFAGYGFNIETDTLTWQSYQNIDVAGKWAMVLRGDPELDDPESIFIEHSTERIKALNAKDYGAAGIIMVTPHEMEDKDKLLDMYYDKTASDAGIPVINITREVADKMLAANHKTVKELEQKLNKTRKPHTFELPVDLTASTHVELEKATTQNVVGILHGQDELLRDQYIVVGAHYDHLGMGGPGSGSRMPDTVAPHYGADDNASGVATVLELAQQFSADTATPKRSMVFIAFGGEEMGLLGSKYFINSGLIDKDQINTMMNFDMVGRLDKEDKILSVGGTGTADRIASILDEFAKEMPFKIEKSKEGYGPSDHAAFYAEDVPVIFLTTGPHSDYHTPKDKISEIDFSSQERITEYAYKILTKINNMENPLAFKRSGVKARSKYGRRFKVTLGIIPDVTSSKNNGLGVDGVREGGPADRGGMKKGDRIISMNGEEVSNIYDYMGRLQKLKEGETATVEVMRNGKKEILLIQL
ncbi:MAG: M20/M25/M40 family metallo-hydrolase [Bacteroidales bacterium]|nr:M20/M25/M40 family metallo-hydrolase [Bacteroidales bacterium]